MNIVKESLNKSWSIRQVPETAKYEAQNAGNIGNISKFCNEVVGCLRKLNADHGLIQRFLKLAMVISGVMMWHNTFAEPQSLQQLMAALTKTQSVQTTFSETKTMSLLSEPLLSSGKLLFKAPDYLEKRVLSPQPSYYIVDGDEVTIGSAQHPERHVVLFQFPALEAFIAALRATLAGDIKTLKEYYDVGFENKADRWTLRLEPKNDEMRLYVKKIQIQGSDANITQIDTLETNNDRSVMTIHHGNSLPPQ